MSEQNFKAFELKVKPDEYGNLNKPLPDTVPKPNVGCGIRNDECFGLIFAWIVAPEEAMDYDSVEDTVKDVRLSLMENMGLLECKNGLTAKGHKYIYAIRKIQETVQGLPKPEVSYLLNLNVNVGEDDYFINGSFTEEGMTGARDSFGFAMFQNAIKEKSPEKHFTTKEMMKRFFEDPYDSEYREGFLMNFSERDIFDERFPDHPLSIARKYVKWVLENN